MHAESSWVWVRNLAFKKKRSEPGITEVCIGEGCFSKISVNKGGSAEISSTQVGPDEPDSL